MTFWAVSLIGWLTMGSCFGQVTNLPPANLDLPGADFSVVRVFGALALVVALFLLGVWGFKQWQRFTLHRGRDPKLKILEVRPLGQRSALYVVAYEDHRLLLAASPGGVQMLTPLTPSPPAVSLPALQPPQPMADFAWTVEQAQAQAQAPPG